VVRTKFDRIARPVLGAPAADRLADGVERLDGAADLREVLGLL